jgi:hypothetical protein
MGDGRLTVTPRSAPFYQPRFAGGVPTSSTYGQLFQGLVYFTPIAYPNIPFQLAGLSPISVDTAALGAVATIPITTGPFKELNVALLAGAPVLPMREPRVYVHPFFSRDTTIQFFADQDGTDDGARVEDETGLAFCNNATGSIWVDNLRAFVERHEGIGAQPDSHYGIYLSQFAGQSRFDVLEQATIPLSTPAADLKMILARRYVAWDIDNAAPHQAIDVRDGADAALNTAAGCALDYDYTREFKGRLR